MAQQPSPPTETFVASELLPHIETATQTNGCSTSVPGKETKSISYSNVTADSSASK